MKRGCKNCCIIKIFKQFWKTLDIPLLNCKINLILTWSEKCIITSKATRDADPDTDPVVAAVNIPTNATFKITDTKFPVVPLLAEDNNKLLEVGYSKVNVKLSNSQLNKLKSAAKNQTGATLRRNIKMFNGNNLPHELLLRTRQTTKFRNAFKNNMSTDLKLSKAQISRIIQPG